MPVTNVFDVARETPQALAEPTWLPTIELFCCFSKVFYVCHKQAFSQYLAYRRDNNELLLFVLKQLSKEQVTFFRSRHRSQPDVIEIQEDEFTDRVRCV